MLKEFSCFIKKQQLYSSIYYNHYNEESQNLMPLLFIRRRKGGKQDELLEAGT